MHYLHAGEYTYLSGEINALYHEAAVKAGISDSIQNILYVICEKGGSCSQSEISKLTGMSRQTINSAIETGKQFAAEKIEPLFAIENKIWGAWTEKERQQYLQLTRKYRDALKAHLKTML